MFQHDAYTPMRLFGIWLTDVLSNVFLTQFSGWGRLRLAHRLGDNVNAQV